MQSAGVVKTSIVLPSSSKNSTSKNFPSYSSTIVPLVQIARPSNSFVRSTTSNSFLS